MEARMKVVIIGGGIAGLTAAWSLSQAAADADVTVLEGAPRWGGKIQTDISGDFVLDVGPEAVMSQKPELRQLCQELGIEDELVGTRAENRRVYICGERGLQPLPEGMTLLVPTQIGPFLRSRVVSPMGKLRMGLECLVPARQGDEDESVGSFVSRRLGREAASNLGEPILGSIFATDINQLSLLATLPHLRDMERRHGSLLKGMLAGPRHGGGKGSAFLSLRKGLGQLTETLVRRLALNGATLRCGVSVIRIEQAAGRWRVVTTDGDIACDACILAVPSPQAAMLLRDMDRTLSQRLSDITWGESATVCMAWPRDAVRHPLDGTGFVVSPRAGRSIVACTWSTSKWEGRAPAGQVLLRASMAPALVRSLSDEELCRSAIFDVSRVLGITGGPAFARLTRFSPSTPQYRVNHLQRVSDIEARQADFPGLWLTGASYRGSGIPDCIRHARATAAAAAAWLQTRAVSPV